MIATKQGITLFAFRVRGLGSLPLLQREGSEDYPDMSGQFYSDGKFQTVTLSASHPEANVVIRLGPKAGVLRGTVVDARSNESLSPCVEFRRAAELNNFFERQRAGQADIQTTDSARHGRAHANLARWLQDLVFSRNH